MNASTIQSAIDQSVDSAIEREDFKRALRLRWVSHANHNATFEPDDVTVLIQRVKYSDSQKGEQYAK